MASCLDPGAGRGIPQWQSSDPRVATDSVDTFYGNDQWSPDYFGTSVRQPVGPLLADCGYLETHPSERKIAVTPLETKVESAGIPTPAVRAHAPPMSAVAPLGRLSQQILCRQQGFAVWPDGDRRRRTHRRCNRQESASYNCRFADHFPSSNVELLLSRPRDRSHSIERDSNGEAPVHADQASQNYLTS
jgi:hypothetical protein